MVLPEIRIKKGNGPKGNRHYMKSKLLMQERMNSFKNFSPSKSIQSRNLRLGPIRSPDVRSGSANDSQSEMRFYGMNKIRIEYELDKQIEKDREKQ